MNNFKEIFVFLGFQYICTAHADVSQIVYIGEDAFLECNMSGALIAWNFYPNVDPIDTNEIEISYMSRLVDNSGKYAIADEGRILTIANVTAGDAGRYMCDSLGDRPERQRFNVTVQRRTTRNALSVFLLNVMATALCVVHATALPLQNYTVI